MTERERIGPVNLVAESELTELEESRLASQAEREELGVAINRLRGSIGSLNREGRARLLAAFQDVDRHFRSLFTTLFEGGQAHLELVESDDPLEAGLEIMAQPPGKRLSTLTLLSGGEQALTAIALIFALFLTNPAPICVLDEVDAPLDDANIERFCDLLDRMTAETDTRYLIVTHNAVTMSRMHRLFGVTMIEKGVSRLVSVDLGGAERLLRGVNGDSYFPPLPRPRARVGEERNCPDRSVEARLRARPHLCRLPDLSRRHPARFRRPGADPLEARQRHPRLRLEGPGAGPDRCRLRDPPDRDLRRGRRRRHPLRARGSPASR